MILIASLLCYETILYFTVARNQPLWHDEGHFVDTIKYFADGFDLAHLKNYQEMSTPLPFLTYALWGKIAGYQLPQLRLLSLIIALITFLLFYIFFYRWYENSNKALILTAFLVFQPYMIGLTVFIYTDMLTMFFLAASLISFSKNKPFWFSLSLMGGLLSRQYFIFWCLAAFSYFLWILFTQKDKGSYAMMLSILVALLPVVTLFYFWKGISPQNELQEQYISQGLYYHRGFTIFYICVFFIYLSPLILWRWKYFYTNLYINISSLILSALYFLHPVKASEPVIQTGVFTTGYFHRLVRLLFSESGEHVIFYLIFLLSLPVFLHLLKGLYQQLRFSLTHRTLFSDIAIFSFLFTMSFSYLNWEKYLLPVIPFAILSLLGIDKIFQSGGSPKNNAV